MVGSRFPLLRLTVHVTRMRTRFIAARHSAGFSLQYWIFRVSTRDYSRFDLVPWIFADTSPAWRRS
jgi:hypothetical protein